LRKQSSKAGRIEVFLRTNPFRQDLKQYNVSTSINLIHASCDPRQITSFAKKALDKIFREGFLYKKVGVYLDELTLDSMTQQDLFDQMTIQEEGRSKDLMQVIDQINAKFGRSKVHIAAEGFHQPWKMNQNMRTPAYTTSWASLVTVKID
jgi:DNA polymerase V